MKKLILSIALCCAATNFFAQNADPAQLVNDGKAALEAKITRKLTQNLVLIWHKQTTKIP